MSTPIVTLTTDWGQRDFFAAAVKGKLCTLVSEVRIIDLSHEQQWNDLVRVRDMVRYGCLSFPQGTIHIIDIGCTATLQTSSNSAQGFTPAPVLVYHKGQYLICSDIRPLTWALDSPPDMALKLPLPDGLTSYSFLALDLYCDVAAQLLNGGNAMGDSISVPLMNTPPPNYDGEVLETRVLGVDKYGNANLDITYEQFEEIRGDRRFRVQCDNNKDHRPYSEVIRSISRHYNDARLGTLLLTVSATGHLQLAVNGGSAASLLGIHPPYCCRISFIS